jgi:amidase
MADLHDLTALEQARAIRVGEVSPTDLAEAYLDRIENLDGKLSAYLTVTRGLARAQSRRAEAELRDRTRELSPLHGVPVAVKDVTRVAGVRCTFGSAAYSGHVAGYDEEVVVRMRDAGTVLLGKTNTPEFALACYTENRIAPPTRNPWDLGRSPGGSSGGAAAAVAAGLAPLAHGTDHGGSIRTPASACGLVGIKPTRGRVPHDRTGEFSGLSTHGPLARCVADAVALLDVMAGEGPGSDTALLPHAGREPGRLRVAAVNTPSLADASPHPDCRAAHEDAAALLSGLGHEVEERSLREMPHFADAFIDVMATLAALPEAADELELMPFTRTIRVMAGEVSGRRLALAMQEFQAVTELMNRELFDRYDVVLSPTLAQPPVAVGALRDDEDQEAEALAQTRFMPFTPLYNVTGMPSVNVPLFHSGEGLPIGVMLSGRRDSEPTLIALASQLEAARPWLGRTPPVW